MANSENMVSKIPAAFMIFLAIIIVMLCENAVADHFVTFESKVLNFSATFPKNSPLTVDKSDEALKKALTIFKEKLPTPIPFELFSVDHGKLEVGEKLLIGYFCFTFLDGLPPKTLMESMRSSVMASSRDVIKVYDVAQNVDGSYFFSYELPAVHGEFISFGSDRWTVVCGGNYTSETKEEFVSISGSIKIIR